jgi:hypothetical protein
MSTANNLFTIGVIAVFVVLIATYFSYNLWLDSDTMPSSREGFGAPALGAGIPDCLRSSQEASDLYVMLSSQKGSDGLSELQLLLSKLACFKKDLMSPSGIVEATRYQPYSTSHDIEPLSETTARCLAKTIPPRDLDIALDKWKTRGTVLVKRLCGALELSDKDLGKAKRLFEDLVVDISDVAKAQCLVGEIKIDGKPGPRDVGGYVTPNLEQLRKYEGYY